jgi:effector-binding domain-containing protein
MALLKKIVAVLGLLLLVVVGLGMLLPKSRHLERSIQIEAPPCVVFAQVNGFKHYRYWSPFAAVMPDARYSWEGPDFGVGASMTWEVDGPQGAQGRQTIVNSDAHDRVDIELDLGPQGLAQSAFVLRPNDGGTALTWSFDTDFGLNIVNRFFGLFLERELGPLHAQGLANIKRIAEDLPAVDWSDLEIGLDDIASQTIAYVSGSSGTDPTEVAAGLGAAYGKVAIFISANGLQMAGAPLAIVNYRDERGYSFDAGIPVSGSPARGVGPDSSVRMGETFGGRVVRAVHVGSYDGLNTTYDAVQAFIAAHRLERNGRPWDSYVSDPGNTPAAELETEVYYPVK